MTTMIDSEILLDELYKELEEVSQKHAELYKKMELIKANTTTLGSFISNTRFMLDTLCEAAQNDQRSESVNHFINLVEHEVFKR